MDARHSESFGPPTQSSQQTKGITPCNTTPDPHNVNTETATAQAGIDLLLQRKGSAIAATAWECFLLGGRGALLTDGKNSEYLSQLVIRHHPALRATIRRNLFQETKAYEPRREIVLEAVRKQSL